MSKLKLTIAILNFILQIANIIFVLPNNPELSTVISIISYAVTGAVVVVVAGAGAGAVAGAWAAAVAGAVAGAWAAAVAGAVAGAWAVAGAGAVAGAWAAAVAIIEYVQSRSTQKEVSHGKQNRKPTKRNG